LDPEAIYKEVLQEEQQKGSSPPVAEGRAKAARQRAHEGSPHPKEPKWWPGAQPQFEGGNGAAPAEAEEAENTEESAEEQPAADAQPEAEPEAPAEGPAAEEPGAQAPAEQPAAQAPAEQPAAQAPAEQPAAQAPAAATATAEAPGPQPTVGVKPGLPSGNRLRPEDAVSTEAQFDGQRAMEQRRKLIDELVATGVPSVTAAQAGRERSPWVSILFLVVPLVAILFIVSNSDELGGGTTAEAESGGGGAPEGTIVAEQSAFNTDTIELKADGPAEIPFENLDSFDHNIAIYENESDAAEEANAIFDGEYISGTTITYEFDAPPAGEYPFQCDLHPETMAGTTVVE
jgi:plastocyanin